MSWCRTFTCTGFLSENVSCSDCGAYMELHPWALRHTLYDPVTQYSRALCQDCYDIRQPKPEVQSKYGN
jgi:hypothetical protein